MSNANHLGVPGYIERTHTVAKTAEMEREPHSTDGVDKANDMSEGSVPTPNVCKNPSRCGYVVRLHT